MGRIAELYDNGIEKDVDAFLEFPTSLYIHLPWCLKKCEYCDFNSHATAPNQFPEAEYTEKLILDLEKSASLLINRKVQSIFIGGGTPSLFSPKSLDAILSACKQYTVIDDDCEITLETNPGTFETQKFAEFLDCGVNRLSIGVQSFKDQYLQSLGRIHNAKESLTAIDTAASLGFENINIDLMFGLPEQTLDDALNEVSIACQQAVQHISYYQLTLEPNTVFYRYPPTLPDSDVCWEIQCAAIEHFKQSGFERYEVSAYSQKGAQCKHNKNYWQYGDYLGIGAGAHSKIMNGDGRIMRSQRRRQPESYIKAVENDTHILQQRIINDEDVLFEFMLNNLRLTTGFTQKAFESNTDLSWQCIETQLDQAMQEDLIEQNDQHYRASEMGYRFLDQLVQRFLPTSPAK